MFKYLLATATFILASQAIADSPAVWYGSTVKWLPAGLRSAGVCKLASTGVMTSGTVADGELSSSYLYADGTRALTGAWNAGQNITAPAFIGALTGNADTATALAANPAACSANQFVTDTAANGDLTCSQPDHGNLAGLSDDDHSQYALLAGRSGGQTLNGGTASGDDLTISSTANATKGTITAGIIEVDEANNRVAIGMAGSSPSYRFHFQAGADDYAHGVAFSHALGGANALTRFYQDLNGNFSIANPNQLQNHITWTPTGQTAIADQHPTDHGATMGIRTHAEYLSRHTLALTKKASQTGKLLDFQDTDYSSLASVDVAGAATFAGLTISGFTAGVAKFNGSGVISSGSVALGSEVSGTLPVANGGTGLTGGTSGGIPYYSGASTIASSGALSQYQVVLGGGAGGAPNVVSGTGTSGQVLTSNGAGANPTWQDVASGGAISEVYSKTTSGSDTWTPSATGKYLVLFAGGGGGGGGGGNGSNGSEGGEGGGGSACWAVIDVASTSGHTIDVGTGGSGGAATGGATGSNGSAGNDTTITNPSAVVIARCKGGLGGGHGANLTSTKFWRNLGGWGGSPTCVVTTSTAGAAGESGGDSRVIGTYAAPAAGGDGSVDSQGTCGGGGGGSGAFGAGGAGGGGYSCGAASSASAGTGGGGGGGSSGHPSICNGTAGGSGGSGAIKIYSL